MKTLNGKKHAVGRSALSVGLGFLFMCHLIVKAIGKVLLFLVDALHGCLEGYVIFFKMTYFFFKGFNVFLKREYFLFCNGESQSGSKCQESEGGYQTPYPFYSHEINPNV